MKEAAKTPRDKRLKKGATIFKSMTKAQRKPVLGLIRCVLQTLRSDGKIGMGTGMCMLVNTKTGEKKIEHWSNQFFDALDGIGISVDREEWAKPVKRKRK